MRGGYLASPAVAAGNGSALARSWRLVVLLRVLWRGRRLATVWVLWRRAARPLIGAWQAVWLLVLGVLMLRVLVGHVWSRLLGRGWREGRVDLVGCE